MNLLHEIEKTHTISIDFDGVILRKFLNRKWADRKISKENLITQIDNLFGAFIQPFRKAEVDVKRGLDFLSGQKKKLVVLTGRNNISAKYAITWLNQTGLMPYFEKIYYPDTFYTGDPNVFKRDAINNYSIDLHFDDDPHVIDLCSRSYPDKAFVLFGNSLHPQQIIQSLKLRSNVMYLNSWTDIHTLV